jgi:hypothetical protein
MNETETQNIQILDDLIDAVISFIRSFQGKSALCLECEQRTHIVEIKEFKRQNKAGWTSKFLDLCLHRWTITLFPFEQEALEGEVKCKGKTNIVARKSSPLEDA